MSGRRRWTKWRDRRSRSAVALVARRRPASCSKSRIEQAEQPVERGLVAAVRRRGQQHQVARRRLGEPLQQLVALVAALAGRRAGVRLVDDDELGAGAQELGAAAFALDVVEADDGVRVGGEDALARRQARARGGRRSRR